LPSRQRRFAQDQTGREAGLLFSEYNSDAMRRVLIALLLCSCACAQDQQLIKRRIQFTAIDKKGKVITITPLTPLTTIVNDGYRSLSYTAESTSTLPLRVGLVVDASNSVRSTYVDHVVGGAVRFLRATLKPNDAAFVISVHSEISVAQDWTSDGNALFQAVNKLRADGGTALFDGVYFGCKKLAAETAASRKIIIAASDGDDNQSRVSLQETINYCKERGVAVFALDYAGTYREPGERGERMLSRLARQTGGFYYAPSNDKEIIQATEQLGFYWNAGYAGTATFQFLPDEKKIKDVYVLSAADLLKFKATLLPDAPQ
jgi:Ca-activated chloride channel family protein